MASRIVIQVAGFRLGARLETDAAPRTCEAFSGLLPLEGHLLQARWSGESAWVPLGALDLGLTHENPTSHPAPGHLLLYPGGVSETEILFPYGTARFASVKGALAGNHFATIDEGTDHLPAIGHAVLWEGAKPIVFSRP